MAKKQLRTVKKSNRTGRLDRDEVRAAVIDLRDGRNADVGVVRCATSERPAGRSSTRNALTVAGLARS